MKQHAWNEPSIHLRVRFDNTNKLVKLVVIKATLQMVIKQDKQETIVRDLLSVDFPAVAKKKTIGEFDFDLCLPDIFNY
jgi:hypothetical protein